MQLLSLIFGSAICCVLNGKRHRVMGEGKKITTRCTNTHAVNVRSKLNAPPGVKPSRQDGGFPDNSTCIRIQSRVRKRFIETQLPAEFDGRALLLSTTRFCPRRRWRMSLLRSSVFAHPRSLPQQHPSRPLYRDNWKKWMDHFVPLLDPSFFSAAPSTSQSDTPSHSIHFSPPLCQCTADVDGAASRSGLRGFTGQPPG